MPGLAVPVPILVVEWSSRPVLAGLIPSDPQGSIFDLSKLVDRLQSQKGFFPVFQPLQSILPFFVQIAQFRCSAFARDRPARF